MENTHRLLHQETDAAADLPALLRAAPAALAGWGLQALFGWLIARWFGRVATQIEQLLQMFRAGHFLPMGQPVVASRQDSAHTLGDAEAAACGFGGLESGVGSEMSRTPLSKAAAQHAGSGLPTLRRVVAVARALVMRARKRAMWRFNARGLRVMAGAGRVLSAYNVQAWVLLVGFQKS